MITGGLKDNFLYHGWSLVDFPQLTEIVSRFCLNVWVIYSASRLHPFILHVSREALRILGLLDNRVRLLNDSALFGIPFCVITISLSYVGSFLCWVSFHLGMFLRWMWDESVPLLITDFLKSLISGKHLFSNLFKYFLATIHNKSSIFIP